MSAVAIIPARGGSKRIPRKNIRKFCGKPIIAYSIQTAVESELFDRVVVSTEDEEIKDVARAFGAEVINRPHHLATDSTPTAPVIRHAINYVRKETHQLNFACCIYPVSPFLTIGELQHAFKELVSGDWDFVISATEYPYPIQRSFNINSDGSVEMSYPEHYFTKTQDLAVKYHDADKYYWGKISSWIETECMFSNRTHAVVTSSDYCHVVDNERDWGIAEDKFRKIATKG